ncbi:hypothetical protein OG21DRAFT_1310824 [Imleria badia]|nr:hypothetical protein OG21DRAFT_1310824 [Imleria badia]
MFGHVNYDSRIQTLWVANSRRDSLIALKIGFDVSASPSSELVRGGFFEQVVEFSGPKPTINFVILPADAGDETHAAACVAAKVPPGELALVSFSLYLSGVDQVIVRREWYESALVSAVAKFPSYAQPQVPASAPLDVKPARQIPQASPIVGGSTPVPQQVKSDLQSSLDAQKAAVVKAYQTVSNLESALKIAREEAEILKADYNIKVTRLQHDKSDLLSELGSPKREVGEDKLRLPLGIADFKQWMRESSVNADTLISISDSSTSSSDIHHVLAHNAFVKVRSGNWSSAYEDAEMVFLPFPHWRIYVHSSTCQVHRHSVISHGLYCQGSRTNWNG